LEKELDKNGQAAVVTKIYDESKVIAGTKPIWRTGKAQDTWDSYALRKIIPIGNTPIETAILKVNCDDVARIYVNGKLLDNKKLRADNVTKLGGERVAFEQLSAFMYDRTYEYDIKSCLFTNVKNTILVELGNQTYTDNHAYLSAYINVTFSAPTVAKVPEKPKKITPKPTEKPVVTSPIPAPTQNQVVVIPPAPKLPEVKDMEKLKVGDVMELKDIYFKKDEYVLGENSQKNLKILFNFLQKNSSVQIEIGGHTNLIPDEQYCYRLSENRANAVQEYLVKRGINANRLQHKGFGKSQPKVKSKTPEANQQNQRVEIKILAM
jgi:outer membrane protein OmpA-like peptidoglycan-associated protein